MTQVPSPAPALLIDRMVVGGDLVDARSGETFAVHNPADGSVITRLPAAEAADVDHAVKVAREAQRGWAKRSIATRSGLLRRWADLCQERVGDLAKIESLDVGKPIATARAVDGSMLMENMRYYAGMPDKLEGRTIPVSGRFVTMVVREPIGVVAGITPWNFALVGAAGKAISALAAGNSIVIKPSPLASLSALALAALALEAGIPPGMVNVVTDAASAAGEALVSHPGVGHISFTGSDAVGRKVAAAAGAELKTCTMELGGKSPLVVFDDADIKSAATSAFLGIFLNAGEMCTASSRLLVHRSVHDELLDAVTATAGGLVVGDPADESTVLGPVISAGHRDRVEGYVSAGRDEGARLVTGGTRPDLPGYYVTPTVFDDVEPTARIAREEIFGPVLSVMRFTDEDEALHIANDVTYGLGSGVFTSRLDRALRFADRIEAGNVWVNAYNLLHPAVPFGGYKDSGFGREGGFSGMSHFTREKSVWFATG
ncbi:aldehyde dehydrogenase [Pseudonocardia sp. WMMC193]|uniref:aldehyde dehydrogenase family protein n=1 Tax=Pseudonocardia sp. WMMC193 TaxID=2911965 RepID=UPI001F24840F|nr:aldehyde dehydrogenase family protein [Pseudonocardia sp. WMMC193]MCF7550815.1 aldehyde dehydrogenase family protein [Pseudonocardia sp. WMMC193]